MYSHQELRDSFSFHATASPSVKTETCPEGLKRETERIYESRATHGVWESRTAAGFFYAFVIEGQNLMGRVRCPRLKELNPSVIFWMLEPTAAPLTKATL